MKPQPTQTSQRGIALIIVLAFLVLIAGLMIAFFANVSTEFSSARSFADGVTTKQLADSAVNVVMGQIREATAVEGGAWASQPGMIRVYGTAGTTPGTTLEPSDKLHSLYKLYSSEQLVLSGSQLTPGAIADNFQKWWEQPAAFTDLNQPVKLTLQSSGSNSTVSSRYPIMDPSFAKSVAAGGIVVEGFDLAEDLDDKRNLPREEKIARMPARWIYVLRDGTLTTGKAKGTTVEWDATTPISQRPSTDNPIIGRIAYWTDDESSKVNINTAGGFSTKNIPGGYDERSYFGSFWDTPRTKSRFETGGAWDPYAGTYAANAGGLAISQPLNGEFQRYPGHPATTSLGLIFGSFLNSEQIYRITPRLLGGGSKGGTAELPSKDWAGGAGIPKAFNKKFKKDRLYASVDELLLSTKFDADQNREANAGALTPDLLEKTRFFLTAHSRAPELNLLGRPRVSLWPVRWDNPSEPNSESYRTGADRALAFCATLGQKDASGDWSRRFYFQRYDPYSTSHDASIPRNTQLYNYLQELTGAGIPGFGPRSFANKFGADRDQILTEMFDQIRAINLRDGTELKARGLPTAVGAKSPPAGIREREKIQFAPRGLVVPTVRRESSGKIAAAGIGRFPTISEVSIVLYHAGYVLNNGTVTLDYKEKFQKDSAGNYTGASQVSADLVRAFLVFEMFIPSQGYSTLIGPNGASLERSGIELEVTGMDEFQLNNQSLLFPRGSRKLSFTGPGWGLGAGQGFQFLVNANPAHNPTASNYYPFQSELTLGSGVPVPVAAPGTPSTVALSNAKLRIRLLFKGEATQNFELQFPTATVPTPTDAVWISTTTRVAGETRKPPYPDPGGFYPGPRIDTITNPGIVPWACDRELEGDTTGAVKSLAGRLRSIRAPFYGALSGESSGIDGITRLPVPNAFNTIGSGRQIFQPGDTVRSLIFQNHLPDRPDGDFRIAAVTDPSAAFRPHPDYSNSTVRRAQQWMNPNYAVPYFANWLWGRYEAVPATGSTPASLQLVLAANATSGPHQHPIRPSTFGQLVKDGQAADLLPAVKGVLRNDGQPGDFDTGLGHWFDGPFSGKTDDGLMSIPGYNSYYGTWGFSAPYFNGGNEDVPHDSFFSPNRQVSSAVIFGSLPAGRNKHWETLCFSPNPAGINHPGNAAPKDSLLLDLFHMPVVEPYSISEPLSTAGKVNMNYGIAPFNWIQRSTAVRAALQSTRVTAIPFSHVYPRNLYKGGPGPNINYRLLVDRDETLKASDALFAEFPAKLDGGFYKSATQICDRFLYPKTLVDGTTATVPKWAAGETPIKQFWYGTGMGTALTDAVRGHSITGDNLREKSYGDLYPRLTTKSNTYTVHMRVQTLRKVPGSNPLVWKDGSDQVTAEYRGSTTLERYIDPDDRRFNKSDPDTVKNSDYIDVDKQSLEPAYRFRVVNTKRFLPY